YLFNALSGACSTPVDPAATCLPESIFARTQTAVDAAKPRKPGFASAVNEVGKLPTSPDPCDPDPVAVVIERRIGKLRRRDHESAFLDKSLRHNAVQLGPEVFLLPILKNTGTGHGRLEFVTEIVRHHRFERLHITFRHGFAKAAKERLKIDIAALLAEICF